MALESKEVWPLLDLLLKDKSTGVSSQAAQTWKEITNVVAIFRQLGGKEQVGGQSGYGGHDGYDGWLVRYGGVGLICVEEYGGCMVGLSFPTPPCPRCTSTAASVTVSSTSVESSSNL